MYSQLLTPAAPFQVNLSSRPVDVDYTPAPGMGYLFLISGILFISASVLAFVGEGGWVKYLISGGILFIALMMIRLGGRAERCTETGVSCCRITA